MVACLSGRQIGSRDSKLIAPHLPIAHCPLPFAYCLLQPTGYLLCPDQLLLRRGHRAAPHILVGRDFGICQADVLHSH